VEFTKLYEVYSFKQARVFKDVLAKHAHKRATSTDEVVRDMQKLAMNSAYGKTLENKRRRGNGFKVHTDMEAFVRNASYKRCHEFRIQHYCEEDESFLGVTSANGCKAVVLDTPRILGWAVLEYAKMVMTAFLYYVMKPLFGETLEVTRRIDGSAKYKIKEPRIQGSRLKLLYTDTDSLYYEITFETDPNDYIMKSDKASMFDFSQTEKYHDTPNKNKLGCFKYEGACNKDGKAGMDNEIVEAIFLAPKSYIKKMAKEKKGFLVSIAGKGIPGRVLKKEFGDIEYYHNVLDKNQESTATFRKFQSKDHVVKHCEVTKVALTCENDKVYHISPTCSRPLGHWRNRNPEPVDPEWALKVDQNVIEMALEMLAKGQVIPPTVTQDDDQVSTTIASDSVEDFDDDD
jgi:hypothetical protein